MLSNSTFVETIIQRLLDGIFLSKKELGVGVQCMLEMSRGLYTGGNFKQYIFFGGDEVKFGTFFTIITWQFGVNLFLLKYYCAITACTIYTFIWNMSTNREMRNFQKFAFFFIFFILLL